MNKLASINYDVTDLQVNGAKEKIAEVAANLSKEARAFDLPEFEELQSRPTKDFALITQHSGQGEMKKYAKYNKEITEINLKLLEKNASRLPDEVVKTAANNLVQAAEDFGMDYDGPLKGLHKQAGYQDPHVNLNNVDDFAYREKIAEIEQPTEWAMPSLAKYPIQTPNQIKEACAYFEKNANEFEIEDAVEYAKNVQRRADETEDVEPTSTINKFAAVDPKGFNEELPLHIDVRKGYLTPDQDSEHELYEDFTKTASDLNPPKAAKLLEAIDKKAGLHKNWGKGIENPALSVFDTVMEKEARNKPTLLELQALDNADLTTIVGNDVIGELKGEDGVAVYDSLPVPIKREIDKLLEKQNV